MINARQIRKIVEDNVNFDLSVNGRKRKESDARALFYKLCREYTNDTYETIGEELNRDHTTVIHGVKNIFPVTDQVLYTSIKQQINSSGKRALGIKALNTIANIEYAVNWSDLTEDQIEVIKNIYFLQK